MAGEAQTPDPQETETGTDDQQVETQAQQEGAPEQKPAEQPRRWKLKVDGREEDADEAQLLRYAQIGRAKDQRFAEAKRAKAEAEELVSLLKGNPRDALKRLGVNLEEFSEEILAEILQEKTLTEDQKKIRDYEKKLKAIEDDKAATAKKLEEEKAQKLFDAEFKRVNAELPKVLTAAGLPKTPKTLAMVASIALQNLDDGLDLTYEQLAEFARDQYLNEIQEMFGAADGETLLKLLGDANAKKIRKADLARLRGGGPQVAQGAKPKPTKPKERSKEEYLAYLRDLERQGREDE